MFDIGFWELVLIGVVTLFAAGPERLPVILREIRSAFSQLRKLLFTAKRELYNELNMYQQQDLRSSLDDADDLMRNAPDRSASDKQD